MAAPVTNLLTRANSEASRAGLANLAMKISFQDEHEVIEMTEIGAQG